MKIKGVRGAVVAIVIFAVLFACNILDARIAFGQVSVNTSKEWRASYGFLYGNVKGVLKTDPDDSMIIVGSNIEKGRMTFVVSELDGDEVARIDACSDHPDTLRALKANTTYKIKVKARKIKGSFKLTVN